MKEKLVEALINAGKALVSKRVYVVGLLSYFAVTEMEPSKFGWLCALGIAYTISETLVKFKK